MTHSVEDAASAAKRTQYGNTSKLLDFGHSIVRVNRAWWPEGSTVTLTFMRAACSDAPAQSFEIAITGTALDQFIASMSDDEVSRG